VLLAEVERAAAAAGGWDAVDLIGVGLGPGSFTGLRIGIATARALEAGLGLRAVGVCTLDALACGLQAASAVPLHQITRQRNSGILVVVDARRGEVFAALYSESGERIWEPFVAAPGKLAERVAAIPGPVLAAGSGAVRFRQELVGAGEAGPLAPIYLRPPDAERWRERNTFQTTG
jgi:tRNA threonylcarbamoyladenosine biosynthesis protein TsaB